MTKYRVVTDGIDYKVQVKELLGWKDFKYRKSFMGGLYTYDETIEEISEEKCWIVLESILNKSRPKKREWVTVMEREL